MTARSDIRVLDATIRDGGLVKTLCSPMTLSTHSTAPM